MRAKKRFGQHFLRDDGVSDFIIGALEAGPGDMVLEIGAGRGDLTGKLLEAGFDVHALEIDRDLVAHLTKRFAGHPGLTIHQGDALKTDYASFGENYKVAANLPYQTATPITTRLMNHMDRITMMVLMFQKEVARRITAEPGSKDYGFLTCLIQYRCLAEYLHTVPPGAFHPPPKVESAILRLRPKLEPPPLDPQASKDLFSLIKRLFSQRRKTLINSLVSAGIPSEEKDDVRRDLEEAGIDTGLRPECFSLEEFILIHRTVGGRAV
jgi:16S rRNA (adenine1518-N6/adenine1519-N6)-dimethyltransferase